MSRNVTKAPKFTKEAKDYVAPHLRDLMKNPGPADYNTLQTSLSKAALKETPSRKDLLLFEP